MASLGMNLFGFSFRTSITIYRSFVRSVAEYGLCALNLDEDEIKELERFQQACLSQIYGAKPNASAKGMCTLSNLSSMETRKGNLEARLGQRILDAKDTNLLAAAREEVKRQPTNTRLAIPRILNNATLKKKLGARLKARDLQNAKDSERDKWRQELPTVRRMRTRGLEPLWSLKDRRTLIAILHWRMAWSPNCSKTCRACSEPRASRNHAVDCLKIADLLGIQPRPGENVLDVALNRLKTQKGRIVESDALKMVVKALEMIRTDCLGFPAHKEPAKN